MSKPALNMETLKFCAGAIIVAAAALIMFPGFLSVALGLLRILVIIVIAGGLCLGIAHLTRRLKQKPIENSEPVAQPVGESDTSRSDANHIEVT